MANVSLFRRSLKEWGLAWRIIRKSSTVFISHPKIMVWPLISVVGSFGLSLYLLLIWPSMQTYSRLTEHVSTWIFGHPRLIGGYLVVFTAIFVPMVIIGISNVALMWSTKQIIYNEQPQLTKGITAVLRNLFPILVYAIFTALLGVFLRALDEILEADLLSILVGTTYAVATFLALPSAVFGRENSLTMFGRSVGLVRQEFGDTSRLTLGIFGIGYILFNALFGMLLIPIFLLIASGNEIFANLIAWLTLSPPGLLISYSVVFLAVSSLILALNISAIAKTFVYFHIISRRRECPERENSLDIAPDSFYESLCELNGIETNSE